MIKSIQQTINTPQGIDYELLEDYLKNANFTLLNHADDLKPGWHFKYIRIVPETGKLKFVNSWFCLQNNEDYILFKWWDHSIHSLQKKEVIKMWYKDHNRFKREKKIRKAKEKKPKEKVESDVVFHEINNENKHEVYIGDTLVFKGRDPFTCKVFMNSVKYKKAVETGKFSVGY